jgi:hypothetical protein
VALGRVHHDGGDEEGAEVPAHGAHYPHAGRVARIGESGDLAPVHLALEQRLPLLLVVPAHELDAGQLAAPDEMRELAFVVGLHAAPCLDVVDRRHHGRRRRRARGQDLGGDGRGGLGGNLLRQ